MKNTRYPWFMALLALSLVSAPIYASSESTAQSREIPQPEQAASVPFALPRLDLPSLEETKGDPYLIFHGRDVAAKHLYFGGKTVFISFMNAHFKQNEPINPDTRCAFGLPFFQKHQIDSIMVGSFEKMWYQTKEINALIDIINNIVLSLGYTEIINYGSSMGGFAALTFSKKLSAQKVIAFNPQIDLTKSNAAKGCCKRLNRQFLHTVSEGLCQSSQLYIFYPNGHLEDNNAAEIDLTEICTRIGCSFLHLFPLPSVHHGIMFAISKIGLLPKTLMHIKNNEFDALKELYRIDGEAWNKIKR